MTIAEIANLLDDVRHETIDACRAATDRALVLESNAATTPARLRRMVATPTGGEDR